jgi:hypothetical protein
MPKGKRNNKTNASSSSKGGRSNTVGLSKGGKVKKGRSQSRDRTNGGYRVSRRELWFTSVGAEVGTKRLEEGTFPPWFNNISRLYENFEVHQLRISWKSHYSTVASGITRLSYNSNPDEQGSTDPGIMSQQQGARSETIYKSGQMEIPKQAWYGQPLRKQCRGPRSFIIEFIWNISTEAQGAIDFWIDYDVTFRVPQAIGTDSARTISFSSNGEERIIIDTQMEQPTTTEDGYIRFKFREGVKRLLASIWTKGNQGDQEIFRIINNIVDETTGANQETAIGYDAQTAMYQVATGAGQLEGIQSMHVGQTTWSPTGSNGYVQTTGEGTMHNTTIQLQDIINGFNGNEGFIDVNPEVFGNVQFTLTSF